MSFFKMPFYTGSTGDGSKQISRTSRFSRFPSFTSVSSSHKNYAKHKVESPIEELIEKFQNSKPESVLNEMHTVLLDQRVLIEQLLQERLTRLHVETQTSEAVDTRRHVGTQTSKADDTQRHVGTQTSKADDTRRHVKPQTSKADATQRHVETQTSEAHNAQTQTRYIHDPPSNVILENYRWMQDNNLYLYEENFNIKYENDQLKHTIDELKNNLTSRIPQDYIYRQPFIQPVLQKKVCVEIYVPPSSEVVHSMVDTLKRDLHSKLLNQNIILDFIMVSSTGQKLLREPSIVLCPSFSRLGTDVKSVFAGLQDSGKGTILVVIHYREEHNLPRVKSEQILSDYNRLHSILDMAYINNKGFYNCNLNHNSFDGLSSFLINHAK